MARYKVGRQTEERIINATRALLAEDGMEATTLKTICDRAGVRSGSFYNLFDSKEEAIIRVVRESINRVDPDPDHERNDTVEDLVDAYIRFIDEEPKMAKVYLMAALTGEQSSNGARRRFLKHHQRRVERFASAMIREKGEQDADDATLRAELLLGALDGLAFRWAIDESFDFSRHATLATERFS